MTVTMTPAALRRLLWSPTVAMSGSLVMVAVAGYAFLSLAGHLPDNRDKAAMASFYVVVNTVGQGVFIGLEQEVSRSVSHARATGAGLGPVVRRAFRQAGLLLAACLLLIAAGSPLLVAGPLHGAWPLIGAVFLGTCTATLSYCARGLLGGTQQFGAYALTLLAEGGTRLVPCLALAVLGAGSMAAYSYVYAVGLLFAASVGFWKLRPFLREALGDPGVTAGSGAAGAGDDTTSGATATAATTAAARRTGPADQTGPANRTGPYDLIGPTDRTGPANQTGLADQIGPANRTGPYDLIGPTDRTGTANQTGLADQTGPADQIGPADRTDRSDRTGRDRPGAAGWVSASLLFLVGAGLLTQLVANLPALAASARLTHASATAAAFVQAASLTRIPVLLTGPVTALLLPRLTSAGARGAVHQVRATVLAGVAAMLGLGAATAAGLAVLGPWVLSAFFNAHGISAWSLAVMGVGTGAMMAVSVLQPALVGLGRQRWVPIAWGAGAAVMTAVVAWPAGAVTAAVAGSLAGPAVVAAAMGVGVLRGVAAGAPGTPPVTGIPDATGLTEAPLPELRPVDM